jgi:hypothetical protein
MSLKARTSGSKKAHVELKTGPSHSHKLGKDVFHGRLIDRKSDQYSEVVKDYETGEVLHESVEPLSAHVGHGSARPKK